MSNKKAVDSVSTEELLQALETNTSIEIDHPIANFLKTLDIKQGDIKVSSAVLWEIFNRLNPSVMTRLKFFHELKFFLPVSRSKASINHDSVSLYAHILKLKPKHKQNVLSAEAKRRHFEAFLKTMDIQKGNHKLQQIVLYHIYRTYCIDNGKKQVAMHVFFMFANFYIGRVRGKECYFYLVDQKTANIHQQKELDGIKEIYQTGRKKEIKKKSV